VFYDNVAAARSQVRFAFCKKREVLAEALARLEAVRPAGVRGSLARRGPDAAD
jgi:N-succinyldiaminopimelate aminotransferase